jgi:hypothetical protein
MGKLSLTLIGPGNVDLLEFKRAQKVRYASRDNNSRPPVVFPEAAKN